MRGHQLSPGADAGRCEMQWGLDVNGLPRQCCGTADTARAALSAELGQRGGRDRADITSSLGLTRRCGCHGSRAARTPQPHPQPEGERNSN
mgnify:CR=1 FL=1